MANKTIDALVFCPFYVCEGARTITCEGIISPQVVHRFADTEAKKQHEQIFCCDKTCRHCLAYKSIYAAYEEVERLRH